MTSESVGTARLDIIVDTSQFDTAITAAKRSVSGMSQAAQEEYNKLNGAEKRRIDSLIKQADTLGFTRQQQILYNAALRGTPTNVLDELKKKLAGTGDAAAKAGIQLNQYGISSKQTAAAMRGVPAQITDIFTSLQGGQKPITVLLQQGGQLKDMFGGIRPAAAALGAQILALINPITVTAAVAGTLAAAWYKGSQEAEGFNRALILTGNYAGVTAGQMADLTAQMDSIAGVTSASAAEALTRVAESGRFTGDQLTLVATAAEQMRVATGAAIDETIAKFDKIRKDPVAALLELNEAEHFLTRTQLDRIRTLQEEGNEQEAVTEAVRIYAGVVNERTPQVVQNIGTIESAWRGLKSVMAETWDGLLDIGRITGDAQRIVEITQKLAYLRSTLGTGQEPLKDTAAEINRLQLEMGAIRAKGMHFSDGSGPVIESKDEIARAKLLEDFNRRELNYLDAAAKKKREIAEVDDLLTKKIIDQGQHRTRIAQIEASYAEKTKKAAGRKAAPTDPADSIIARIKQQIALNEAQLKSEDKLTASDRLQVQVKLELERIGGKLTGSKKTLIEAMLAELDASGDLAVKHQQEAKAKADLARLTDQLAVSEENRRRANAADLATIGRGDEAIEMLRRQIDIRRELEDGLDRIKRDAADKTTDALAAEEAALRESIQRKLDDERGYWEAREAMQSDWVNGANRAYENWLASSKDVAGQAGKLFDEAFSTLEDIGVDALSGNLKSWDDYFESLNRMILRFIVKQQLAKIAEKIMPGKDADSDNADRLSGAAVDLAASAAPLTVAATAVGASAAAMLAAAAAMAAATATSAATSGGNSFFSMGALGGLGYEKGGAFANGVQAFAKGGAFTNQVVTQPTQFRFAKGIGLMGEAGPEAIMPLKRGRDGRLGVAADAVTAPAGGGDTYNISVPVQGHVDTRTKMQIATEAARQIQFTRRNS